MRKLFLRASLVATLLGILPLAHAGPDNAAFKTYSFQATGGSGVYPSIANFFATSQDDPFTGVPVGLVSVFWTTDGVEFFQVACSGPSMANAVSVNQGNGRATVSAVLDPNSVECSTFNYVGPPLTVNLTGASTGDHSSNTGSGTATFSGMRTKYNFQQDSFSENFIGMAAPGFSDYEGVVSVTRRTDRQQTK
jgi:hypothetical protein